jgi:hypothetical protein
LGRVESVIEQQADDVGSRHVEAALTHLVRATLDAFD